MLRNVLLGGAALLCASAADATISTYSFTGYSAPGAAFDTAIGPATQIWSFELLGDLPADAGGVRPPYFDQFFEDYWYWDAAGQLRWNEIIASGDNFHSILLGLSPTTFNVLYYWTGQKDDCGEPEAPGTICRDLFGAWANFSWYPLGDGNPTADNTRQFQVTITSYSPVPEPAIWGMLFVGLGMIGQALRVTARSSRFGRRRA